MAERAFGQGQYDYLRRLASDLKEEDDGLKRNNEGSIRAIGIVGGDVFDKLLVLRALKPEFPEAVFFTDDYDALLGLQSELRWTRNLLVASSFGPKLRRERQRDLPPFRNYAETSAFLATQLAVTDINNRQAPVSLPASTLEALFSGPSADSQERRGAVLRANAIAASDELETPAKKEKREIRMRASRSADTKHCAGCPDSTAALSGLGNLGIGKTEVIPDRTSAVADLDVLQHNIRDWLEKPQIFEVERTGGMLALSENPRNDECRKDTSNDTSKCKDVCSHNLLKCASIQPDASPLYSDIDRRVQAFIGLIFICAWIYGGVRLNAYRRTLKHNKEESHNEAYPVFPGCSFSNPPALEGPEESRGGSQSWRASQNRRAVRATLFGARHTHRKSRSGGYLGQRDKPPHNNKEGGKFTFANYSYIVLILSFAVYIIAGVVALGIWHLWPTSAELITHNGDPMVLIQGVSVWPAIYLRAFTLALTAWFIFDAWRKLDENLIVVSKKMALTFPNAVILRDYKMSRMQLNFFRNALSSFSLRLSDKPIDQELSFDMEPVWERYIIQGRPAARVWRVGMWSIIGFTFSWCLANVLGYPAMPGRGILARDIYQIFSYANFFGLLFLMFIVVDATLSCFNFVICLAKRNTQWPDHTKGVFIRRLGLIELSAQSALDNWIDVYFIAKRTSCIADLIYYPFVIVALIIISHSSVFGNFTVNPAFVVIMALAVVIVVGCAIWLNVVADQARKMAQKRLSDEVIKARGSDEEARAKQWESLLDRVTNMREGSFVPFLQQPVLGAVLLPLGSLGWTTLFEGGHLFGL